MAQRDPPMSDKKLRKFNINRFGSYRHLGRKTSWWEVDLSLMNVFNQPLSVSAVTRVPGQCLFHIDILISILIIDIDIDKFLTFCRSQSSTPAQMMSVSVYNCTVLYSVQCTVLYTVQPNWWVPGWCCGGEECCRGRLPAPGYLQSSAGSPPTTVWRNWLINAIN